VALGKRAKNLWEKRRSIFVEGVLWRILSRSEKKNRAFHAGADASVARCHAKAGGIEGFDDTFAAEADASLLSAQTNFSATPLGVRAHAHAELGQASVGIRNTPLNARVSLVGTQAKAGVGVNGEVDCFIGAHLAEISVPGGELRAGWRFGIQKNGMLPKVHVGFISVDLNTITRI